MAAGFNSGSAGLPYQLDGVVLGNVQLDAEGTYVAIPVSGGLGDDAWYLAHQGVADGEMNSGYLSGTFENVSGSIIHTLNFLKASAESALVPDAPTESVQFNESGEMGGSTNFGFYDGNVNLSGSSKLEFRDATEYIYSSADGQLDILATTEVQIGTAKFDLDAGAGGFEMVGGAISQLHTGLGDLTFMSPGAVNIASAEAASDAIILSSSLGGVSLQVNSVEMGLVTGSLVVLGSAAVASSGVNINSTTANTDLTDGALTVAGGASVALDLSIGASGSLRTDSALMGFGALQEVALIHLADTGLSMTMGVAASAEDAQLQFRDSGQRIQTLAQDHLSLVANNGTNNGMANLVSLSAPQVSFSDAVQIGSSAQGRNLYVSGNILAGPNATVAANPQTYGTYVSGTTLRLAGSDRWNNSKYFEISVDGGLLVITSGSH